MAAPTPRRARVWARRPPASRMSRSRGVSTQRAWMRRPRRLRPRRSAVAGGQRGAEVVEPQPVVALRSRRSPPGRRTRAARTPQLIRLARWMRAKLLASTAAHARGTCGPTRRRLARGALAVGLAAHDDAAPAARARATNSASTFRKHELRDGRHVGAEHEDRGAGGRDVVGRDLVAELDQHRRSSVSSTGRARRGTALDVGPLHDGRVLRRRGPAGRGRRSRRRSEAGKITLGRARRACADR